MASLVEIERLTAPSSTRRGNETPTYTADWRVKLDDYVPGERAIQLGQDTASTERLPRRGESLRWVSATETYRDASAFALDFSTTAFRKNRSDTNREYRVTVTWRKPTPQNDEAPGSIDLPPLARPPEYWIEYMTVDRIYTEGYATRPIEIQYFDGPFGKYSFTPGQRAVLANSCGDTFRINRPERIPVMVKQINVATDLIALKLNNDFGDSLNSVAWTCRGLTADPHYAKFLRAETGVQLFEDVYSFYRMQIRVAIGRQQFYDRRPNISRSPVNDEQVRQRKIDAQGLPGEPEFCDLLGGQPLQPNPINPSLNELAWRIEREKDYNAEELLRYT